MDRDELYSSPAIIAPKLRKLSVLLKGFTKDEFPESGSLLATHQRPPRTHCFLVFAPGFWQTQPMQIAVGIITISDRASRGEYDDLGGPAVRAAVVGYGWTVVAECMVPDDQSAIQRAVRGQINQGAQLVLTTGGTGVAQRDVTPEAVRAIADKELPGFGEVMRLKSLVLTPNAILSRSLAASVGATLVVCLPGKPQGAVDCLSFVVGAIPHCLKVLQEIPTSC